MTGFVFHFWFFFVLFIPSPSPQNIQSTRYFGLSHVRFFFILSCELFLLNKWSVVWLGYYLFMATMNHAIYNEYNRIFLLNHKTTTFVQYNTHIFKPHAYFLLQFTGLHHEYFLYFVFCSFFFKNKLCHTYEVNLIQKSGYKSWFSYFCIRRVCRELELSYFDIP